MIHLSTGNNKDVTERSLQEQADRRLFEAMRQADEEKFHSRPEWMPEYSIEDDYEDIRRGGAWGAF